MAKGSVSHGGILGSGIFGFFGTTVNCNASDDSIYCNIMKMFNIIVVFGIVLFFLYYAYVFLRPYLFMKRKRT